MWRLSLSVPSQDTAQMMGLFRHCNRDKLGTSGFCMGGREWQTLRDFPFHRTIFRCSDC